MSAGANRLASSTTWVDSALWGSQAEESFCWALLSLPASGPATANTAIQKTRIIHLVQRPLGMLANLRTRFMTLSPLECDQRCAWEHGTDARGWRHSPKVHIGGGLLGSQVPAQAGT